VRFKNGGCEHCDKAHATGYFRAREKAKFDEWLEGNRERIELKSPFHGMTREVELLCKIHRRTSLRKPTYLVNNNGYGCDVCHSAATGTASRLKVQKVLKDIGGTLPSNVQILGVRFDPDKRQSLVHINCAQHGEQFVSKGTLKRSRTKCPTCGLETIGYAGNRLKVLVERGVKGQPTYLGVMEVEAFGIRTLKVGVTTRKLTDRYRHYLKTIFFSTQLSEIDAYVLENRLHRHFRSKHDLRIHKAGMRAGRRWDGDTECYWLDQKEPIIEFIRDYLSSKTSVDYARESELHEKPNFFPRDVSRPKDETNQPIAVIGVDPTSGRAIHRFPSLSDAAKAGFGNLSRLIADENSHRTSGGLRWFKASSLNEHAVPPVTTSRPGRPVLCIDTNQRFETIAAAVTHFAARGIVISSAHISTACSGKRKTAGRMRWAYVSGIAPAEEKQLTPHSHEQ
jgi:hypothetical protein